MLNLALALCFGCSARCDYHGILKLLSDGWINSANADLSVSWVRACARLQILSFFFLVCCPCPCPKDPGDCLIQSRAIKDAARYFSAPLGVLIDVPSRMDGSISGVMMRFLTDDTSFYSFVGRGQSWLAQQLFPLQLSNLLEQLRNSQVQSGKGQISGRVRW